MPWLIVIVMLGGYIYQKYSKPSNKVVAVHQRNARRPQGFREVRERDDLVREVDPSWEAELAERNAASIPSREAGVRSTVPESIPLASLHPPQSAADPSGGDVVFTPGRAVRASAPSREVV